MHLQVVVEEGHNFGFGLTNRTLSMLTVCLLFATFIVEAGYNLTALLECLTILIKKRLMSKI